MRLTLLTLCMAGFATCAWAQTGITNTRDGNGNLIRNSGTNQARPYDPPKVGAIRSTVGPTPATNSRNDRGATR
jgi:hypothetical protein